ncbi:MAG: GAF domain-containing protein [Actinomycetota bacterium]|nr:GAF domain-containing protein [Actinomycetota bacterium]
MAQRVLLVDSDFATRMQGIAALMGAGYEVSLAEDSLEATNVAASESPDLVLIGDSMVQSSGLALVGRLFSSSATAEVPVLVVANTPEGRLAADQAGARTVIAGPATAADLLGAVAAHIDRPGALSGAPVSVLNDEERLAAVDALRLDGSPQAGLDRFTKLASKMLHVPASTITLIERDRQIFASQIGVQEPWASAGETPLEYSYCQYAVTSREPLRIDDANRHPLVQNNLATTELGVGSYLGIPLIMDDDQAVGALCAIDSEPRLWTDHDVSIMNDLAEILTAQLNATRRGAGRHIAA